ncbi:MAG: hypothetical protein HY514_00850 [Candidatus Aenigmarchaeota archaeon]|nr:hypothetical protein [Candidatus Aenigmarchaeota archaeon]
MVLVPDGKVLSDLTYWYFSQDMIARQMYSAGGKYTMRGSVDSFRAWKEQREEARKAGKGYWDFSKHQDEK